MSSICKNKFRPALTLTALAVGLATVAGSVQAQLLNIPNASFESPPTGFVSININSWQKAPKPGYFDESAFGFLWIQTAGIFANTAPGAPDHIDNVAGNQSAYLLAFPGVTLSQDLSSSTGKFQPGFSYDLTVGLLGKGMADGNFFTLSLYYRDGGNNQVPVNSLPIIYTAAGLPSTTHLTDFTVHLPAVQPGDAWAGKDIGVEMQSVFGTGAGYWDVDNVRLTATAVPEPVSVGVTALGLGGLVLARHLLRRRA